MTALATERDWLADCLAGVERDGFAIVENVLDGELLEETHAALYRARKAIEADIGKDRLERAGEAGVLRLIMKYEPFFLTLLELPELLAVVDATVSPTAILHLQNGFILPPAAPEHAAIFQRRYHQDFPRVLGGYIASINVMLAISDFTQQSGATLLVPGSQQREKAPDEAEIARDEIGAICPAGSMIVFDSTLWHCAGINRTSADRLAINHQFVRSFIKQQIDYVRALGEDAIEALAPRTQQLLGYYVRMPTSLDEYYRPAEKRLYRPGQG